MWSLESLDSLFNSSRQIPYLPLIPEAQQLHYFKHLEGKNRWCHFSSAPSFFSELLITKKVDLYPCCSSFFFSTSKRTQVIRSFRRDSCLFHKDSTGDKSKSRNYNIGLVARWDARWLFLKKAIMGKRGERKRIQAQLQMHLRPAVYEALKSMIHCSHCENLR